MKFGLPDKTIEKIQQIFEGNSKVDKAFVFGSRAKGNFKDGSDIDIAIKGKELSFNDTLDLIGKLENLNLPYTIDLINYHTVKEPALIEHIDRVGIEFYSRWKEYRFSELLIDDSISYGIVQPGSHTEIDSVPIIRVNNIKNGDIKTDDIMKVASSIEEKHKRTRLIGGELLITVVGSVGECAIVPDSLKGWNVARAVSVARIKNGFDKRYIKYAFKTDDMIFQMYGSTNDTVQPTLNLSLLKELKFSLPPLTEQIAIASVLSSLDDKIDLLIRQNKILEQLAEALFRQWFVEESDESWKVESLENVFDIGIGRTPPRKEQHWFTLNLNDVKWVSIKDMGTSGIYIDTVSEYLTQEAIERYSVPIIPENTVMLSFKMTIGRLAISTEKMVSNEAIAHFKQKENSNLFPEFLYLFLKTYSWEQLGSTSSIVESINSQMIKEIEVVIPDKQKLNDFRLLIKPEFDKIKSNQIQIRTLTQLRDTLLPKLMSGEVRVELDTIKN
jgi:type I restriction enzyme S subunit